MKTAWFKGARDEKAKEERKLVLISAENAFKILTGILEEKIKEKESERNLPKCYEQPAYPYFQADASGFIRALREVQSLIDLKEK
jgi:hypothetical protein